MNGLNQEYLDKLYRFIATNDSEWKEKNTPEAFAAKLMDQSYQAKVYEYINTIDPTYSSSTTVTEFFGKLRKKKKVRNCLRQVVRWYLRVVRPLLKP